MRFVCIVHFLEICQGFYETKLEFPESWGNLSQKKLQKGCVWFSTGSE